MRIIISDPEAQPSFVMVQINETNELGGGNTDILQVLKVIEPDGLKIPIYFIGRLCYNAVLKRWLIDEVVSNETWEYREEAEAALMTNKYTIIDHSDE